MNELLGWAATLVPYLVALLLGIALPALAVASYAHFAVGVAVIAATFGLDALTQGAPVLRLGITLFVADVPMLLMALVAAARWLMRADLPRRHAGWVLYALVFFGGLAWGLASHGTAAGVQSRNEFYAITAASYAMSFPVGRPQLRQLLAALAVLATLLLLLCVYRWVVYYGNIRELLPPGGSYNVDGAVRVIGASAALALGQALLVGVLFWRVGPWAANLRWLTLPLFGVTVVLQHRSVWLAVLVGVAAGMILSGARIASRAQQLAMLAVLAVSSVVVLNFGGSLASQIQSSAVRAIEGQGTVSARFANWRATLDDWRAAGPRTVLLGREPGGDSRRIVEGGAGERVVINFGAHNNYITLLTGAGVLGFGALLWAFAWTLSRLYGLYRAGGNNAADAALLLVLLAVQLTFYIAYSADYLQSLLFGVALSYAATQSRAAVAAK